jgi:hypothetical protein
MAERGPVCQAEGAYCLECKDARRIPEECVTEEGCGFPDMNVRKCAHAGRCPCAQWEWEEQVLGPGGAFLYLGPVTNKRWEDYTLWRMVEDRREVEQVAGREAEAKRAENRRRALPVAYGYAVLA